MDSAFMDSYIPALRATGGYNDIYDSLDSDDLADVVRVAVDALDKSHKIYAVNKTFKSAEESIKVREQGNVHYVNGEHKQAILCYNKALAFAPMNSLEMIMAYSNTSAVMLTVKAYQGCQLNISICSAMDCPQFLNEKMEKRMAETHKFIMEEMMQDVRFHLNEFLNEYIKFNVRRNTEVPCASDDVHVQNNEGIKKVVAARDIKAGTMVAMERAFVSTLTDPAQYTSCYYCHRMSLVFVPCDRCHALFCTETCRDKCMAEYHRIECHIDYLGSVYDTPEVKLMTRAAIKISLKLGWEELRVASQEIGENRYKKSTVKEAFDPSNPVSMLSYNNRKAVFPGTIFNGSIVCGTIVRRLNTVPGYFPEAPEERKEAIDAISRIMLYLYASFTNRIEILCSAYDIQSEIYKCNVQRNLGWFSFTSKLTHSCEPNLYVLGLNDQVALVALQRIKKGEELTISYMDHFYDMEIRHRCKKHSFLRQKKIIRDIHYLCVCRVCVQEWDADSNVMAKTLTRLQKKTFDEFMFTIM